MTSDVIIDALADMNELELLANALCRMNFRDYEAAKEAAKDLRSCISLKRLIWQNSLEMEMEKNKRYD